MEAKLKWQQWADPAVTVTAYALQYNHTTHFHEELSRADSVLEFDSYHVLKVDAPLTIGIGLDREFSEGSFVSTSKKLLHVHSDSAAIYRTVSSTSRISYLSMQRDEEQSSRRRNFGCKIWSDQ